MEARLALCALCMSVAGAIIDVKSSKIPNWLTSGGLAAGLLFRACLAGWAGLETGLSGALIGGGVLFLPFLAGGIGGGDVKLMSAVGAWVGLEHALALVLATAIAGGALGMAYIIFRKRTGDTIRRVAELIRFHLVAGIRPYPQPHSRSLQPIRFPYSLAIATGALFVFVSISTYARG